MSLRVCVSQTSWLAQWLSVKRTNDWFGHLYSKQAACNQRLVDNDLDFELSSKWQWPKQSHQGLNAIRFVQYVCVYEKRPRLVHANPSMIWLKIYIYIPLLPWHFANAVNTCSCGRWRFLVQMIWGIIRRLYRLLKCRVSLHIDDILVKQIKTMGRWCCMWRMEW